MKEKDEDKEPIRLITTDDGSHSLFVPSLNETYHSFHGAVQESRHVFIDMGLKLKARSGKKKLRLLEVGLGTGLNALLTAEFSKNNDVFVELTSVEAFPVTHEMATKLNYPSFVQHSDAALWFDKIHSSSWGVEVLIHEKFTLNKIKAKLEQSILPPSAFDVVFFDAFAPNKQAELWDLKILKKITQAMQPQGVFVTYCAKGQLKRDLKALDLEVATLPGPPGKKEMVRAQKK